MFSKRIEVEYLIDLNLSITGFSTRNNQFKLKSVYSIIFLGKIQLNPLYFYNKRVYQIRNFPKISLSFPTKIRFFDNFWSKYNWLRFISTTNNYLQHVFTRLVVNIFDKSCLFIYCANNIFVILTDFFLYALSVLITKTTRR